MAIKPGKLLFIVIIVLSLLLTACSGNLATSTPASENIVTNTATAVLSPAVASPSPTNPTATLQPTVTSTPQPSLQATPPASAIATSSQAKPTVTFTPVIAPTPTLQPLKIASVNTPLPTNTAVPVATAPTLPPATTASNLAPDAQEQAFLQLLNDYRKANGKSPLIFEPTLFQSARWMAQDMANKNYIGHTDSLGRSISARLHAFGYTGNVPGENIAGGLEQAGENLKIWQSDDIHKNNLLGAFYTKVGVGRYYNPNSGNRWFWVLDLG